MKHFGLRSKSEKPAVLVDLSKIGDEHGTFSCPKCGALISPDDESEENYRIVKSEVRAGRLVSLLILCQKCRAVIRLVGFPELVEA